MNALKLENQENSIPWYERISERLFRNIIIDELMNTRGMSEQQAINEYEKTKTISIFDEACKVKENEYSTRYYMMTKLNKTN